MGFYMAVSAGLVTILFARSVSASLGDELSDLIGGIGGLPWPIALLAIACLSFLLAGIILVVLYELEEVYIDWAALTGEDSPRGLPGHWIRRKLLVDSRDDSE